MISMKITRRLAALILVFCLVLGVASVSLAGQGSQEKGVLRATLENGLRVVIVKNPLAPVVTTMVNYLAGSSDAPEGFPGMAHALEHMMFGGSPGLTSDQLSNITAAMGGRSNADTQQTVTQYFLSVPAEDLAIALRIQSLGMRGIINSEEAWAAERGAIEQEVAQDLSDPEYVLYQRLLATLFKGTPYAHSPLGTRPSFAKTTAAMLRTFYDTWYAPNNAILVICGDIQPEKVLADVKRFFADIPRKEIPRRLEIHLQPVKPEQIRMKSNLPYGLALISFRMPGYESADYPAGQVLADVLSSQRGSLYSLVVAGKALSTDFSVDTLPGTGMGYATATFPHGADSKVLVKELRQVLADALQQGFPSDLVEAAKRNKITQGELRKNSVFGLTMAWSQALAVAKQQSPEAEVEAIKKVTVADVDRVARQYLTLDRAVIAVLTPEASGRPSTTESRRHEESFTPKEMRTVQLPEWADKALKRLVVPQSGVHPVVTRFANGLILICQYEPISSTVSVYGRVRNNADMEQPPAKEGVADVLAQLFSYGTTALDRVAFQKALDAIGAQESAGADFSLQVLTRYFEQGVRLLADNQLNPALPEQAFKVVQGQVAATAAGRLQSPDYLSDRALKAALFPKDDPTLRQATPATVSSLTLEDVKHYYRTVFRPDLTTIVVIGKISPAEARRVIAKYFGAWKAKGERPETLLPPVAPNTPSATTVPDTSRVQASVVLGVTLGLKRSNPDYYALELGNHVLGGGFYATRLYRDLREQTGLVYYVSSSFDVGKTRALYTVEYGCDPANVSKARGIVENNLKAMQQQAVSPDELHQAKAILLRELPLSESSTRAIARGLIYRSQHDLPLDEPTRAARRYLRLTADQVQKAFARWLRPADLVQVTQGPVPQ
jgi:zinc protease